MRGRGLRQGPVVALAAVVLAVLVAQIAAAGGDSGSDSADIASLKNRISKLETQVAQGATAQTAKKKKAKRGPRGPQGPAGPAGPPGTDATAICQGNGSGDTMVSAGAVCIDRYEVSVWSSPTGGTQYGASSDNYPCTDTGQGCKAGTAGAIYARSVAGVTPSGFITYFQAQQALANVGKRLPTNGEWQQAVAGTPDSTACNISTGAVANTGANAGCVSNFGANDMVGNLYEWVADWVPVSTACPGWGAVGTFSSNDQMCLSGASTIATGPGALIRGGFFGSGSGAGPFAVVGDARPSNSFNSSSGFVGFRGTR
ncbi:MAG: hypothetical protein FJW90_12215 [Actinobacteria bacterium]|nr:hypothetical protein [Actinomycetota bacterium]